MRETISERIGPSNLAEGCDARFLYQRVDGFEEVKGAQAFGTCTHAILQAYFERAADVPARACAILDEDSAKMGDAEVALIKPHWDDIARNGWQSAPALCAQSGLHLLPNPADCQAIFPEQEITLAPHPDAGPDARPVEGTRDLLVRTTAAEFKRLGIAGYEAARGWLVIDFKTSADPEQYAKNPETLFEDEQGICYPLAVLRDFGSAFAAIPCAWTYFPSRAPYKGAKRVDFMQTTAHAEARYRGLSLEAQRKRGLIRLRVAGTLDAHAPELKNPARCGDYRGCKLAAKAGGPCHVKEDFGASANAFLKAPKRKQSEDPTMTAKPMSFAERKAAGARTQTPAPASEPTPTADHSAAYAKVKAKVQAGYDEAAANELIDMLTDGAFKTFVDAANVYDPEPEPEPTPEPAPMTSVAETQGPAPAGKPAKTPRPAKAGKAEAPAQITNGNSIAGEIAGLVGALRELTGCTSVELKF